MVRALAGDSTMTSLCATGRLLILCCAVMTCPVGPRQGSACRQRPCKPVQCTVPGPRRGRAPAHWSTSAGSGSGDDSFPASRDRTYDAVPRRRQQGHHHGQHEVEHDVLAEQQPVHDGHVQAGAHPECDDGAHREAASGRETTRDQRAGQHERDEQRVDVAEKSDGLAEGDRDDELGPGAHFFLLDESMGPQHPWARRAGASARMLVRLPLESEARGPGGQYGPVMHTSVWRRIEPVDLVVAAGMTLALQAEIWFPGALGAGTVTEDRLLLSVTSLAISLPLAFRRTLPWTVAVIALGAEVAQEVLSTPPEGLANLLAMLIVCYSLGRYARRPRGYAGIALIVAASFGMGQDLADNAFVLLLL